MDILVLFGTFILLVILTIPIGYAIGISTLVTLVCFTNMPLALITQNAITGVDSFPLMAIPFFMLAGNLMSTGGVARRIVDFCDTLLGWITGGLAIVTTLACMIFAAISGSAMATTSAIGGFMIPEMTKRGYDKAFSASLAASAGTIGVIIPPSIPFVIYAVVTNQSVSDLFIAGILPGVLMGVALIVVCVIVSKKEGYQTTGKCPSLRDVWKSFKEAFWALMTPVIILGGIYSGKFTPTESAVIAVVYCVIVSVFVYKEFRLVDVYKSLYDSINVNGKDLRSSTFFIKDNGKLIGLLCINFDDSRYRAISDHILKLCHPDLFVTDVLAQPLPESEDDISARSSPEKFRNSADAVALDAINRELERMGVTPEQLTPEKRLQVIAALESGGLFLLKGAVKSAAASLHCSPASVYRYITQIKNSDSGQI